MRFEILFPEVANLYGDPMNVKYLSLSVPGGAEIIETGLKETPRFLRGDVDLVYMGPMPEYAQELAVQALLPHKAIIEQQIRDGKLFLMTGNALEIFGDAIECENGKSIPCLGIFHTTAKRRMLSRYSALYMGSFEGREVVGFKAQFSHSYGADASEGLFGQVKGVGLDGGTTPEGLRRNHFYGTYVIGPICPLNPPFTRHLLSVLGVADPHPAFEATAEEGYKLRVKEFSDPAVHV